MIDKREHYWHELKLLYQHIDDLAHSRALRRMVINRKHPRVAMTENENWQAGYLAALGDVLDMMPETVVNKGRRTALTNPSVRHETRTQEHTNS